LIGIAVQLVVWISDCGRVNETRVG